MTLPIIATNVLNGFQNIDEDVIRLREEISDQIKALEALKRMAQTYGFDISGPATNSKEAVQWLYFAYLAAIKGTPTATDTIPLKALKYIILELGIDSGISGKRKQPLSANGFNNS